MLEDGQLMVGKKSMCTEGGSKLQWEVVHQAAKHFAHYLLISRYRGLVLRNQGTPTALPSMKAKIVL